MSLSCPGGVHQHSSLNLSEGRVITGPLFQQTHMECPLQTPLVFYYIIFLIGQNTSSIGWQKNKKRAKSLQCIHLDILTDIVVSADNFCYTIDIFITD